MSDPDGMVPRRDSSTSSPEQAPPRLAAPGFELLVETKAPGLVRRFITTNRHFLGMLVGGLAAWVRGVPRKHQRGLKYRVANIIVTLGQRFVDEKLVHLPFQVQLRRRLETLGPTYIKLGQVLSLREDLLPRSVTEELKNLLDRLPAVPYARFCELVEKEVGRPVDQVFARIEEIPVGSASIGQIHLAETLDGDRVVLKMVKPGIRDVLKRDVVLLKILGRLLNGPLARFQPRRVISEFCDYTIREVDLRLEADNAETFSANFKDSPSIIFPKIYRDYTTANLLVMEFFEGHKPSDPEIHQKLTEEERAHVVDMGAAAIIRMLYRDGFFHADLHPGNLIIVDRTKAGFIDLGMVGRFDDELRRTLLYYYYCLVTGDAENAARYLAALADPGPGGDPKGFKRDVEEICRRWQRAASFEEFSIGQLIMESVGKGGLYRMYFPVEMVLMVKAIVTFEGVGHLLLPGFDVAKVSQKHINKIFLQQFSPLRLAREGLRGAPELIDALVKAPMLVTEGLRVLEETTRRPPQNPLAGLQGSIFAGFSLVAGAILAGMKAPWPLVAAMFALGLYLAFRRQN